VNTTYDTPYFMENEDESLRLDLKTDIRAVKEQAGWAGIEPGMKVLDVGCGTGKTTIALHDLVQPGGTVTGIDFSNKRIEHAKRARGSRTIEFLCRDFTRPIDDIGRFDFAWVRFILEYFRSGATDILRNIATLLKSGGILCLIDLDYNCMTHYELPARLQKTMLELIAALEEKANFDPYMGRRLYSFLYWMKFVDLRVTVASHHLIYGHLGEVDAYNWVQKIEVASRRIGFDFSDYPEGHHGFMEDFLTFFKDPGRFSYTPLICVRGRKQ